VNSVDPVANNRSVPSATLHCHDSIIAAVSLSSIDNFSLHADVRGGSFDFKLICMFYIGRDALI
jgi:hypothetical protein